ncbi:MAG: two-component system LytT family response regulator [Salibacteraceae bacterium]
MIKAFILVNEQHAHIVIKTLLRKYFETDIELVENAQTAEMVLLEISILKPELLLLDIKMPHTNGLEVISKVNCKECSVIFVTAYDNFALDAFNECARGSLLKLVDKEKFKHPVSDVIQKIRLEKKAKKNSNSLVDSTSIIPLPHNGRFVLVDPKIVLYLQADGSYTKVITEKEKYHISKNLKTVSEEFNQDLFIRVSRSFMVNKNHIISFSKKNGGILYLTTCFEISISATYHNLVFELLNSDLESLEEAIHKKKGHSQKTWMIGNYKSISSSF